MNADIDTTRITNIIEKRLTKAPKKLKESFPEVFHHQPVTWLTISQPEYLMVIFVQPGDISRITDPQYRNVHPFPGLVTLETQGAAFRVENARNMIIQGNKVKNAYALSLGSDSTIIIENHNQELRDRNYYIPLAYIISYGDEINKATAYEYFEGIITYSINMWRANSD